MAKNEKEKSISLGLAGPSIWSAPDVAQPADDDGKVVPDGSEGVADINPKTLSEAQDFARDMIKDGRRADGTGNEFFPSKTKQELATEGGQFQISPTVNDDTNNVFAASEDMVFSDETAEYQKANSTPGVTPNFFKSSEDGQQIDDIIDKTGNTVGKTAKDIVAGAETTISTAVQNQLLAENEYEPDETYESQNQSSTDAVGALTDALYSVAKPIPGVNENFPGKQTLGNLLGNVQVGSLNHPPVSTNDYSPLPGFTQGPVDAHEKGDAISTPDNPNQFANSSDMVFNSDDAQYQLANSTPGVGPNFFKSDADNEKIGDLIDKTGADPNKDVKALYAKAEPVVPEEEDGIPAPGILTDATQKQLEGNKYNPDDEYADISLAAEDVGMPVDPAGQPAKGTYNPNAQTVSPAGLAQAGHANLVEENTNFPVAHGIAVEFSEAEDEIIAGEGDNFFKTATELTFPAGTYSPGGSTPGVGNSFFTPTQVDGTGPADPGFDVIDDANNLLQKVGPDSDGSAGIINTATQTQLAAGNVNDPDDPHTTVGGLQIDFPEPGNSSANTNEPTYPAEQTQKGTFSQTSDVAAHTSFASQQSTSAADLSVNQNHPSLPIIQPNAEALSTSDAQSKIIAQAGDDFFQPPTIDTDVPPDGVNDKLPQAVTYTGLGVPKTEGGDGSPTTKLGTFFTQDQVDEVLNKEAALVGADDKTLSGGELFSSANLTAIESNVEEQLEAGNINTPDAEHTLVTNIDFPKPGDAKGSQAKEVSYPSEQTHMGGYIKPAADKTFAAHVVDQTDNDTAKYTDNTYHPVAPSNVEEALSPAPSDADSFITPGTDDNFFATDTQLAGTPGTARPNFFTEQDAERQALDLPLVPQNVPLTDDNFNIANRTIYEGDVRAKLSAENFFYPAANGQESATQTEGASEDFVDATIEFPDLVTHNQNDGTSTKAAAKIPNSSEARLGEKESERSIFEEKDFLDKADALLDANTYRPRRQSDEVTSTSVANVIRKATEPVAEAADEDGKVTRAGDAWFVPKQSSQLGLDGVVGRSIENFAGSAATFGLSQLKKPASEWGTPEGGVGTKENRVYSSKLVSETGPDLSSDVLKVPRPGATLGNDYFPANASDPHNVVSVALEMLKDQNIYHPTNESPFFRDPNFFRPPGDDPTAPNENLQPMFSIQRALGVFNKPTPGAEVTAGQFVTTVGKDQVTLGDMIKFSQAFRLLGTGDTVNAGNVLNGGGISVIANPLVQMGLQGVDLTKTSFRSIADGTNNADLKAKLQSAVGTKGFVPIRTDGGNPILDRGAVGDVGQSNSIGKNSASFGQLNNYYEPFGNGVLLDSIGMLALAALAIISLLIVALLLEVIVSNTMDEEFKKQRDPNSPETMSFGRNAGVIMLGDGKDGGSGGIGAGQAAIDFFLEDMMRVPRTDYALLEAIAHGMPLMLGFPSGLTSKDVGFGLATGQGLIDFAINLLTAPSYYLNYVRQITMSGQLVSAEFQGIGGAAAQGPEKFFQSLDKLFNSKFVRFVFISAQVGDANLKSLFGNVTEKGQRLYQLKNKGGVGANTTDPVHLNATTEETIGSAFDRQVNVDAAMANDLQVISNLRGNLTRWGNPRFKNTLSLSTFFASSVPDSRVNSVLAGTFRYLKADPANIEHLERAMSAEYMPFYFHDLRTHEIVSIPAFVTSFDESYAVNYNSISTYGRQDPVKIYNGTERTINLGFKLVAFNKSDFKALWYTVNKFVSMVYPQYSKGVTRTLQSQGNSIEFIQPFSQVPAASPLIRIRLGDLFRSNYSTSGLKRLFGHYGEEKNDFKVEFDEDSVERYKTMLYENVQSRVNQDVADLGAQNLGNAKAIKAFTEKRLVIHVNGTTAFKCVGPGTDIIKGAARGASNPSKDPNATAGEALVSFNPKTGEVTNTCSNSSDGLVFVAEKVVLEKCKFHEQIGLSVLHGSFKVYHAPDLAKGVVTSLIAGTVDLEIDGPLPAANFGNDTYAQLTALGSKSVKDAEEELKSLKPNKDTVDVTNKFFAAENNAIRRSFESTRGTGLAGFITSLSLNYEEAVWSTDASIGKAPKEVSISISFAPVHDLPVGLDYNGRLRALSHPAAINHAKADQPGTFTTTYDNMDKTGGNEKGGVASALSVLDKANRGIDDDSSSAFGKRASKTSV